jgi:hypothetical protein
MAVIKRKNAPHAQRGMASMAARNENMGAELGRARARRASGEFGGERGGAGRGLEGASERAKRF